MLLNGTPELITRIWDIRKQNTLINEDPSLISQFDENKYKNIIFNLIFNPQLEGKREFIRFLGIDLQKELLITEPEYNDYLMEEASYNRIKFGRHTDIARYISQFSEDAIILIAREDEKKSEECKKHGKIYEKTLLKRNYSSELIYDLTKLPMQTQLKLLLVNAKEYANAVSEEAILTYVNGNPLLFDKLPEETKKKMVADNPELITKMPLSFQQNQGSNERKTGNSTNYHSNYFNAHNLMQNPEEYIRRISAGRIQWFEPEKVTDTRDNKLIWRMAKYEPKCIEFFHITQSDDIRNRHLVDRLYEHALELGPENELCTYLKNYGQYFTQEVIETMNRIGKLLVSEDIPSKITPALILDYAKQPTHEKLVEIVKTTYGDTAARILEDRPQITAELIPNFDIFKPEIIEEFGVGTIHAMLTYDMQNASATLGEIARNPELMKKYKTFNRGTEGLFEDTAVGLDEKLEMFMDSLRLMDELDFSKLTDKQKETLQIIMLDKKSNVTQEVIEFPGTQDELETYMSRRERIYDEAIKKEQNPDQIKQFISRKYFGIDYMGDIHHLRIDRPTIYTMCKFYNVENFINNRITLESGKFSSDELDTLELLSIFKRINDTRILADLEKKMHGRTDIINPLALKKLQKKVPEQYDEEMAKALITPEKAMEMIQNGEEGIRVEEHEGIKVIFLEGCEFTAYISNPFLGNSGIHMNRHAIAKEWQEMENGISNISGCIIDQDETTSTVGRGGYGIGFGNINPNQIIGMGITDIHMGHNRRNLHSFTTEGNAVSYDYPEEFMTRFSKRIKIEDPYGDTFHQYNEMAVKRNEEQLAEIKEGTHGGKINPDYIFVNGTDYRDAMWQAQQMGIKYVFVYDEQKYNTRYNNRIWEVAKKPESREQSEFMREVQETIQGGEDDGR